MGNNYSLLNTQYGLCNILTNEIVILENNIKKINNILELLNDKCDTLITKVIKIDKQVYEIIDYELTNSNQADNSLNDADLHDVWDYSDLQ